MGTGEEQTSKTQRNKRATKRIIIEVILALTIIASAIVLCINLKNIIINRILKTVRLQPNTEGYETWLNPPTTITRGYHLFNINNPNDIVTDPASTTVSLKETPAYSYSLSATKNDIQWSNDDKEISYSIHRIFTRHPTQFDISLVNDTGVFVDMLRAIFRTQYGPKPSESFYALGGMNTFYHRNAIEQLEGFTSDLFNMMRDKMVGPNTGKSGFIYRYNGSRSYNYTIRSGLMEKGQVLAFASENVPFSFSSPIPYPVTIYDGLTFVPMLFDKPIMHIFQADFCRPITVKFNRVLSMFGGIDVHEYVIKFLDFDTCPNITDINSCPELDKIDVSKCISASLPDNTVFLSKPHFYGSTNETMEELNIEGFTPTRDQHEALIYFEPYSGTPLRAHHRVQLNIDAIIDPMRLAEDGVSFEPVKKRKGVKRMIPLVWIDQEVNIDDATIRTLRLVHLALRYGTYVIMIVAIILVILIIGIIEVMARRASRNERLQRGGSSKTPSLLSESIEIQNKETN